MNAFDSSTYWIKIVRGRLRVDCLMSRENATADTWSLLNLPRKGVSRVNSIKQLEGMNKRKADFFSELEASWCKEKF